MKVLFFSGGKDSVYAYHLEGQVDLFFVSIYEFPRPSPHLVNIHKVLELAMTIGVPTLVVKLPKGREFENKVSMLRRLGAKVLIAGDQAVESHLQYMERLASEVGAVLREPLWGRDPEEVVREEVKHMDFLIIGANRRELICRLVTAGNVEEFLQLSKRLGVDPLGERGEYHSLVVRYRDVTIPYVCRSVEDYEGYYVARL